APSVSSAHLTENASSASSKPPSGTLIAQLTKLYPDGILLSDVRRLYQQHFGVQLPKRQGTSLKADLEQMSDAIRVVQNQKGVFSMLPALSPALSSSSSLAAVSGEPRSNSADDVQHKATLPNTVLATPNKSSTSWRAVTGSHSLPRST